MNHIFKQTFTLNQNQRERLNDHKAKVIWLTGLSGSGKSTLANALENNLYQDGYHSYILDGDNLRFGLNSDLGFSIEDRSESIRRAGEAAKLLFDAGLIVIVAHISPFEKDRSQVRQLFKEGQFIEVFVNTPMDICESRDSKGLYAKARQGIITNMTGINSPYEAPKNAEIVVTPQHQPDECIKAIRALIL
jgi:adenylyl-sulfate kinase